MWAKTVSRKELLELLQSRRMEPAGVWETDSIYAGDQAQIIWRLNPGVHSGLPVAIVADATKRQDILAWIAAYLRGSTTLQCAVNGVKPQVAEAALRYADTPSLAQLEEACLGVIFTEAVSHARARSDRFDFKTLNSAACTTTFSFPMARALAIGALSNNGDAIIDAWEATRAAARQPPFSLATQQMRDVWATLSVLRRADEELFLPEHGKEPHAGVTSACIDLYKQGKISGDRWDALVPRSSYLRTIRQGMRDSLEGRVRAVERGLNDLRQYEGPDQLSSSFLAGYVTSRIAPGTLDHLDLLLPHIDRLPLAPIWYGLCAGLQERAVLQGYLGAVGRRVVREINRPEKLTDTPRCDIAVAELTMLMGGEVGTGDVSIGAHGFLDVELVPCVSTVVRWGSRASRRDDLALPIRDEDVHGLVSEFGATLRKLETLYRRLAWIIHEG